METIEKKAKEFADGVQLGIFDSLGNKKIFCDLLTMFAEKVISQKNSESSVVLSANIESAFDTAKKEKINGEEYILFADARCILLSLLMYGMALDQYQQRAMMTCMPSCENFTYMLTELNAEVGEINDKIAKWRRKGIASIKENDIVFNTSELDEAREYQTELAFELGDALWAIAGLAHNLGFSLEEIGQMNIRKLADRKKRGVIDGTGDKR